MTDRAERWIRVEQVCQAALDRSGADREAFVREACAGDEEIRREVEGLLAEQSAAKAFLDGSVGAVAAVVMSATGHLLTGQTVNGLKVGPLLGAGGMGEVYKAHDSRLGRDVAIKVLPSVFAGDPERLRRFEHEARAIAALSHSNVVVVHDVGTHNGNPYVVTELLDGQDLRHRLADGSLPQARAVELAIEIALGLAAAHERGIIHRDIKPENLFVKSDGHLKILDFGLAKLTQSQPANDDLTRSGPRRLSTELGMVLGTAGYMSPEQVRGEVVDHRSDLFTFGAVLYEMLSGCRAFTGDSTMDTMSAVLKDEPPSLLTLNPKLSPLLDRIVGHCLRKRTEDRFQSARDLAFALDAISLLPGSGATPLVRLSVTPTFRKLTFRRGNLLRARFTPDGQSVVYSAAWDGQPCELYMTRIDGRESRRLGVERADVLSVSRAGELAILLKETLLRSSVWPGTLARVPIGGGSPREILEDVVAADWAPDGELAVMVGTPGIAFQLEFPLGRVLLTTRSMGGGLRVSPDGRRVVFAEATDNGTALVVVDRGGARRVVIDRLQSPLSIVWSPDGAELVFTQMESGEATDISAVTLDGHRRLAYRVPGAFKIGDISSDGTLLLVREVQRLELRGVTASTDAETELSWLDGSDACGISDDGRMVAFTEDRDGGGPLKAIYVRNASGAEPVLLGTGYAWDLSPDGLSVLTQDSDPNALLLLPTRAGRPRNISCGELRPVGGRFITNDLVAMGARRHDGVIGLYTVRTDGSELTLVTDASFKWFAASPDNGRFVLASADRGTFLLESGADAPRPIPQVERDEIPLQLSADGGSLFVRRIDGLPLHVHRVNLENGERTLWRSIMPPDPVGVIVIPSIRIDRSGRYYVYTCARQVVSELFVAGGLL